jgi:hypothetical protein
LTRLLRWPDKGIANGPGCQLIGLQYCRSEYGDWLPNCRMHILPNCQMPKNRPQKAFQKDVNNSV